MLYIHSIESAAKSLNYSLVPGSTAAARPICWASIAPRMVTSTLDLNEGAAVHKIAKMVKTTPATYVIGFMEYNYGCWIIEVYEILHIAMVIGFMKIKNQLATGGFMILTSNTV